MHEYPTRSDHVHASSVWSGRLCETLHPSYSESSNGTKHSDSGPVSTGILPGMQGAHHSSPRQKKRVYDSAAEVSPLTQQDCPAENKAHDVE